MLLFRVEVRCKLKPSSRGATEWENPTGLSEKWPEQNIWKSLCAFLREKDKMSDGGDVTLDHLDFLFIHQQNYLHGKTYGFKIAF